MRNKYPSVTSGVLYEEEEASPIILAPMLGATLGTVSSYAVATLVGHPLLTLEGRARKTIADD